ESLRKYPCGDEHTPSPIASLVPIPAVAVVTAPVRLTAVAVATEMNNTVVFLGDRLGRLHKVFLKSLTEAQEFSALTVQPGSPIGKDLFLDPSGNYLYVLTSSQVTKVPVAECWRYPNCTSCLAAQDPYCGWCVLDGRCSRKLECVRHQEANHWLRFYDANGQCLSVQSKIPANLSREEQAEVTLTLDRLPNLKPGEGLKCSFGEEVTPAVIVGKQLTCWSPSPERLPGNDPGKGAVRMELAVRFADVTVVSTEFVFYDCSAMTNLHPLSPCQACVTSAWSCKWCARQHRCLDNAACGSEVTLFNQNDHEAAMSGPDHCPYVEWMEGSTLIPVGHERALKLIGWNLDLLESKDLEYQCVLEMENYLLKLKADVQRDTQHPGMYNITCQAEKFHYSAARMEYEVSVYVQTGGSTRIDSRTELKVTLYDCAIGQSDCSRCQVTDGRLGCVWCGGEVPACMYRESCPAQVVQSCPLPRIEQVWPLTAPPEGGVALTITGTDLGQRVADIEHGVEAAGLPCIVDPAKYRASARIVCRVSASDRELSGPVKVTVRGRAPVISSHTFTYQEPDPRSLSPTRGPLAGGTTLTLRGSKLLTGSQSDISVFVGDLPCHIVGNVEFDRLLCRTSPSNQTEELRVSLQYGQARKVLEHVYEYTSNPQLTGAEPTSSYFGGGREIHVQGQDLTIVQDPRLQVWLDPSVRERREESRTSQPIGEITTQDRQ
ncbi:plexin-B3-like, partial [Cetorhinus maximus]